ncbi:hypothetical protein [Microbacterium sp. NPDC087665]|uniref:hypothetical protein n=1 Tax=Microbacterium sp. NPDC087665 TaxID=3364194 RepID=UPI0038207D2C
MKRPATWFFAGAVLISAATLAYLFDAEVVAVVCGTLSLVPFIVSIVQLNRQHRGDGAGVRRFATVPLAIALWFVTAAMVALFVALDGWPLPLIPLTGPLAVVSLVVTLAAIRNRRETAAAVSGGASD